MEVFDVVLAQGGMGQLARHLQFSHPLLYGWQPRADVVVDVALLDRRNKFSSLECARQAIEQLDHGISSDEHEFSLFLASLVLKEELLAPLLS